MNKKDWAIMHRDYGFNPIPIIPGSRATPMKWGEFQNRMMTYEEIESWWSSKDYNIGLVCGEFTGLVVVDADDAEAISWCNLTLDHTPMRVITNRGMHYYYRHPGGYVDTKACVHPGVKVDVRGDGGNSTAAGSVHKSGHIYKFEAKSDMHSIHDLPMFKREWFPYLKKPVVKIERQEFTGDSFERASRYMAKVEGVGSGLRNQTAFKLAARLFKDMGLSEGQTIVLMDQWNQLNDPPISNGELITTVKSACA